MLEVDADQDRGETETESPQPAGGQQEGAIHGVEFLLAAPGDSESGDEGEQNHGDQDGDDQI